MKSFIFIFLFSIGITLGAVDKMLIVPDGANYQLTIYDGVKGSSRIVVLKAASDKSKIADIIGVDVGMTFTRAWVYFKSDGTIDKLDVQSQDATKVASKVTNATNDSKDENGDTVKVDNFSSTEKTKLSAAKTLVEGK